MKLQYTYLILFFTSYLAQAEPGNKDVNVNVNLNLNQNQSSGQTTTTSNDLQQLSSQKQTSIQDSLQNLYNDQMQKCHGSAMSLLAFIGNNKIKCTCATLAAIYTYTMYQIYTNQQIMNDPASWCNWRNDLQIEKLLEASSEKTGLELLHEIQSRYADPTNPTNFIYSLVQFIRILQDEIEQLEKLKNLCSWIDAAGCSRLFFIDATTMATIQAKMHKILFIKHIFATWYATYKMDRNI